jgi:1D-myo-inositol 3-kinase
MDVLDKIDFLKIGEEELRYVDLDALSRLTPTLITEGAEGCRLLDHGKEIRVPAFPAKEVDSSGAGDCFVAGFAYALTKGLSTLEALRWGNYFGALAVSQVGVPDFSFIKKVALPLV